jgi:hypothetical protein
MMVNVDEKQALELLMNLRAEHRALDAEVAAITADAMPDQLKLMRLKRYKLALKDRIAQLEDEIHPDIIA